ncbi:efflux RND transporter periplasmic adaptor subunit [uncultured Paludibaculum sp.]|uniref:efflux RND transporter periplasmic adaptor subunit n=1 Tax=uncultured Paludibaculum sp. TaxID=1765020 RepID=UPI002AAB9BDB|nr:HlyD family efflux transporter periplasmic adaptor subunit [uncultured Paludibaculum sp.]
MSTLLSPSSIPPSAQEPEAPPSANRTWSWLFLLILTIGGVSGYHYFTARQADARRAEAARHQHVARVRKGDLLVRVRLSGSTSARNFANVVVPKLTMPESDQPLTLMTLVSSGALVHKGQVVAAFDPQGARDHLDDTVDGLRARETTLKRFRTQLEVESEAWVQELRKAKATLDRARLDLRTLEVRSAIQQQLFQLAVEEAQAAYEAANGDLPIKLESQAAALRINELTRDVEKLHVARHQRDIERMTIHAPAEGMAVVQDVNRPGGDRVAIAVGDRVTPGTLIMRVIDRKSMQVEGYINQSQNGQFHIGQEATVRLEAFPDAVYKAKVSAVGALATTPGRSQYFIRNIPIRMEILDADDRVLPDLSASADVVVDHEKDVLLAPAEAIQQENGETFVYVRKGDSLEKRNVTRGRIYGPDAVLTGGVEEGEEIVIQ